MTLVLAAAVSVNSARAADAPEQRPAPQVQAAFDAVLAGDHAALQHALDAGLDVTARNVFHLSLLDAALVNDDLDAVALLLDAGYDPNAIDRTGDSLLGSASLLENLPLIKLLLARGADPYKQRELGDTPLDIAARTANPAVLKAYTDAGVKLADYRSSGGATVLHEVADYYYFADAPDPLGCAKLLLGLGLDVNARDDDGATPLMAACSPLEDEYAPERLALIDYLLAQGADVQAKDHTGETPLAASIFSAPPELLHKLVEAGADINAQDTDGDTALHKLALWAEQPSDADRWELVLSFNPDLNLKDADEMTPLHVAISRGNPLGEEVPTRHGALQDLAALAGLGKFEEVKQVVELDNAVARDSQLATLAVSLAAKREHGDIAHYLIEHGAQPRLADCVVLGDIDLLKQRLEAGDDPNGLPGRRAPLYEAASLGNIEAIKLLAAHGADLNIPNAMMGRTPLEGAIRKGQLEAEQTLLKLGADTEARFGSGMTALHWACMRGSINLSIELLDAGADVAAVDSYGRTPLHYAVQSMRGESVLVKYLVQYGAPVNAQDKNGDTPLHDALSSAKPEADGSYPFAEALLDAGADPNIADQLSFTPLTWALAMDDLAVAEFLLKRSADPDAPLSWGGTALLGAVIEGKAEQAELLRRYHATEPSAWLIEQAKLCKIYGEPVETPTEAAPAQ